LKTDVYIFTGHTLRKTKNPMILKYNLEVYLKIPKSDFE